MDVIYLCPALDSNCKWEGSEDELTSHFENNHHQQLWHSNLIKLRIEENGEQNHLIDYFGEVFLVQALVFRDEHMYKMLNIKLRYLGPQEEALKINYSLTFYAKSFTFNSKEETFIKHRKNGSIEANLDLMVMYENTKINSIKCQFNFENLRFKKKKLQETLYEDVYVEVKQIQEIDDEEDGDILSEIFEKNLQKQEQQFIEVTNKELVFSRTLPQEWKEKQVQQEQQELQERQELQKRQEWKEQQEWQEQQEFFEVTNRKLVFSDSSSLLYEATNKELAFNFENLRKIPESAINTNIQIFDKFEKISEEDEDQTLFEIKKRSVNIKRNGSASSTSSKIKRRSWGLSSDSFGIRHMFEPQEIDSPPRTPLLSQSQLYKSIICPQCGFAMTPPIFMCNFGHSICGDCKESLCKICPNSSPVSLRSTSLEVRSKSVLHSCRFSPICIVDNLPYNELKNHVIHCKFMVYSCPSDTFKGSLEEMKSHFKIMHPSIPMEVTAEVEFTRESFFVTACEHGFFLIKSSVKDSMMTVIVNFCSAFVMYFKCELTITSKKGKLHKYVLERSRNRHQVFINLAEIHEKKFKKGTLKISVL